MTAPLEQPINAAPKRYFRKLAVPLCGPPAGHHRAEILHVSAPEALSFAASKRTKDEVYKSDTKP